MSYYYQTQAITLGKNNVRENDRLYSFYTEHYGKVTAIATGSRKIKSRLVGHLEPFGIVKIGLARGYKKNRLMSAMNEEGFHEIFNDIEKIFYAGYCLRLVNELVREGTADHRIYELLKKSMNLLAQNTFDGNIKIFNTVFTIKLLSLLGYEPQVQSCVNCKRILAEKNNVFSFVLGGILCDDCRIRDAGGVEVAINDIKLLRFAIRTDISEIFRLKANGEVYKKFNTIVSKFLVYRLK